MRRCAIFSCTCTHTHVMLRCSIFSCTCTHTSCYAVLSSLCSNHCGRRSNFWCYHFFCAHVLLMFSLYSICLACSKFTPSFFGCLSARIGSSVVSMTTLQLCFQFSDFPDCLSLATFQSMSRTSTSQTFANHGKVETTNGKKTWLLHKTIVKFHSNVSLSCSKWYSTCHMWWNHKFMTPKICFGKPVLYISKDSNQGFPSNT